MTYSHAKVAGALIFVATSQFVIGLIIAETLHPGYSVSTNYISDLGVGEGSSVFNSSIFLMGLMLIVATYFLQRAFNFKLLTLLLALTSLGAMGVGVFTEHFGRAHLLVSAVAFLFGGLSCIASARLLKLPFSVVAVTLGLMSLGASGLYAGKIDLGLGLGGMERMIAYPILMWGAGFGGYLLARPEAINPQRPQ
jgi:hypothetical membrane protein